MDACPACQARLETPLGCTACGVLLSPGTKPTPFEAFGLEPAYAVDQADLKKRLMRFARAMHPDYFATQGNEQRERAERNTAELNAAYELLRDDLERASWLIEHRGGPTEQQERAMPQEFLIDVLDWNEAIEAAREAPLGSAEHDALFDVERDLASHYDEAFRQLGKLLTGATDRDALVEARRELNELRYIQRTLAQIDDMKRKIASTSR